MKIGLLLICTGEDYRQFIAPLLDSVSRYFLKEHEVNVHLWTDSTVSYPVTCQHYIGHRPWPMPTLLRYHRFLEQADRLIANDYLFYLDVDMRIVDTVGLEVLGNGITAVEHPGFAFAEDLRLPYEKNPRSTAYVQGQRYYCGGVQGGKTSAYLEMAHAIRAAIDNDLARDHIARWHDESHYNKFLATAPPSIILDPSYCYPEDAVEQYGDPTTRRHYLSRWGHDYPPRILALAKSKVRTPQSASIGRFLQARPRLKRHLQLRGVFTPIENALRKIRRRRRKGD